MSAALPHDSGVHLAAVHADPEARPVVMPFGGLPRGSLKEQARARGADRVIGLVACLPNTTMSSSPTIWCTSPPAPPSAG